MRIEKNNNQKAFSLVELSIVLVILGLLTGGILTGQSLIRAAELRAIIAEKDQYITAINTFKGKYLALPGDMPNATDFWGDTSGGFYKTITGEPAHYRVYNGNGDGYITCASGSGVGCSPESMGVWRHLSLAGMIEGSYSGQNLVSSGNYTAPIYSQYIHFHNETTPTSPESKVGLRWYTAWHPIRIDGTQSFDYDYGNYLLLGKSVGSFNMQSTLKVEEVWSIDKKLDDGKPGIGKVLGYPMACTDQTVATQGSAASYNLSYATSNCGVIFGKAY